MRINKNLAKKVFAILKKKKLRLSCCESMTGGLFASTITSIPGASTVFDRGIVTYSDQSKIDLLDVDSDTIKELGAISSETAREMVEGLSLSSKCDVCISVTGNAGPKASEKKPVGLYYIGFRYNGVTNVIKIESELRKREDIQKEACNNMLKIIYECLK